MRINSVITTEENRVKDIQHFRNVYTGDFNSSEAEQYFRDQILLTGKDMGVDLNEEFLELCIEEKNWEMDGIHIEMKDGVVV